MQRRSAVSQRSCRPFPNMNQRSSRTGHGPVATMLMKMQRGPPSAALSIRSKRQRLWPAQRKYPDTLRVRRRVDLGRAALLAGANAGRDTRRRLDLKMRDLQARQVARCAAIASAIIVAANDAEVCRDVQLLLG